VSTEGAQRPSSEAAPRTVEYVPSSLTAPLPVTPVLWYVDERTIAAERVSCRTLPK
jgi:hypothetical protein